MNDSFNMTRVLSVAACTVLCAGMLTGCFGKKDPAPSTEPTSGGPNLVMPTETTAPATTAPTETTAPATEAPAKKSNVATVKEKVGVRSAPTTDSNVLSQLNAGDEVEVNRVESNGGTQWAYIPLKGWVDTQYLDMSNVTAGGATGTPAGSTTTTPAATTPTAAATTPTTSTNTNTGNAAGNAVITATTLNIRETPDNDGKILGGYVKGEKVTILETKNGWGRTNRGWISMVYVSQNGTTNNNTNNAANNNTNNNNTTTNAKIIDKGIVTGNNLNIRSGAGTNNKSVGSYSYLTRVEFTEKKDVDSTTWGKTKDGWISLDYVYIDGTSNGPDYGTGTVTGSNVNVRSGPGKKYNVVGSVTEGDEVDILASFEIGGSKWGCIKGGWVSMDYVDMD